MSKSSKAKIIPELNLYSVIFIIAEILLILSYGGFFELPIALLIIVALALFTGRKFEFKITLSQSIFLLFSIWYLFCSVKNGFVIEYATRGMIPFATLLFWIYASNVSKHKEKIADIIIEASMWIAVVSVIHCIVISIDTMKLCRITFPFDYSNACGIYFACMYFFVSNSKSRFLNRCKYIFLLSLLLTQSVGAIGIFLVAFVYCCIRDKHYIKVGVTIFAVIVLAFIFKNRIIESSGTFLERLLHIYDGILCMIDNPVLGIGAGWWGTARHYYQTGFYNAEALHSSIVAIGVNSGFVGVMLLAVACFAEFKKIKKNKSYALITFMILAHSILDFTLSFMALNILLVFSLESDKDENAYTIKPIYKNIFCGVACTIMIFLAVGLIRINVFQNSIVRGDSSQKISHSYENSFYLKSSMNAQRSYATVLYTEENTDTNVSFNKYKYLTTEMILYHSISDGGGEKYLLKCLESQPYNTTLRDYIVAEYNGKIADKAETIVNDAADKTSFLGKILYKLKGENQ